MSIALALILFVSAFSAASGSEIPSLPDTVVVREWLVAGPFSVGVREGIAGVVEDPATLRPVEGETLRSALVQGGAVTWRRIEADSLGWLETAYDSVRWDTIQDYWGIAGLMSAGFACAEFDVPFACRALAVATKLGGFTLNGRSYLGDVYGNGWFHVPVLLDSGINRVVLRLTGYGDQRVRFALVPACEPLVPIVADATVPDLIADSAQTLWLGIPLLNTMTSRLDSVRLSFSLGDSVLAETTLSGLAPLCYSKPALRVRFPAVHPESTTATAALVMTTRLRGSLTSLGITDAAGRNDTIPLRIRSLTQPHKVTFISKLDSSCQYYAVFYPKDYDRSKRYGIILSLHGAGVEASGLAECFRPKDWAFVVCPTNRRPYGFDWQDWGRLDAIEVLDRALAELPIDPDRVTLTGHSMGGHGTWHVGLAHPDRFAAAAPAAGWPTIQLYVPTFLQRSAIFAEPAKLALRDMAMRPDNAPAMLANALNLPLFILHGGDDDNVPPIHGRAFAAWLDELGYQYRYKEVPGVKHWWNYPDTTVCVDDPDLMDFLKNARRNSGPRRVFLRTADLGQNSSSYWVAIEQVRTVGRDAEVEATASDTLIEVRTANVARLRLDLDSRLFFKQDIRLVVDGQQVGSRFELPANVTIHRSGSRWRVGFGRRPALRKTPALYGPAKQALMSPFCLVYGTQDSALAPTLRHAATQEAMRWFLIGNGLCRVLPDTEVTDAVISRRNLVLYGGPNENWVTRRINSSLPVRVSSGRMLLGRKVLGENLAAIVTYPNPLNPRRLVLARTGTDPEAIRLSLFFSVLGSSTGVPDFLIFDRRVRRYGWQGIRAAGFFGPDWKLDPNSTLIGQ